MRPTTFLSVATLLPSLLYGVSLGITSVKAISNRPNEESELGLRERRGVYGRTSLGDEAGSSSYLMALRKFQQGQQEEAVYRGSSSTLGSGSGSSSSSDTLNTTTNSSSSSSSNIQLHTLSTTTTSLSANSADDTEITGLDGWHIDTIYTLAMEQLDPVVSPNKQSSHMHNVISGNNFGASYSYEDSLKGTCSSVSIQADKSNYWVPQLYFINDVGQDNQTFIAVPSFIRFYYHLGRNTPSTPVQAFPPGLRMLIGDPEAKAVNSTIIGFWCHVRADYVDDLVADDFNFDSTCQWGMKVELNFPACWDGYNLYKSDGSHMAYPLQGIRSGPCPWTHPVRLPTLLLEHTWHVEEVAPGKKLKGNLAWANGDTTGGGAHGDFTAGWEPGVLETALNDADCVNLNKSIAAEYCPSLKNYMNVTAAAACLPLKGVLEEPFGNDGLNVTALPGCNLLWGNTTTKPTCDPAVAALDVSALTGTDGAYTVNATLQQNTSLPVGTNWTVLGCFADLSGAPVWLDNATTYEYTDAKNSVARCTRSCELNGMPFTGLTITGSAYRCACSSAFNTGAGVQPGECATACPGNKTDDCGASYIYQVLYKAEDNLESATSSELSYIGCMADGGWIDDAGYSYTGSAMNVSTCQSTCEQSSYRYSGLLDGNGCYCSNSMTAGSGNFVPDDSCATACSGNSTQTCGGASLVSLYNNDVSSRAETSSLGSAAVALRILGISLMLAQLLT